MRALGYGLVAIGFAMCGAAAADTAKLPERKAGLWELSTTMDEGLGPKDQTMKICIDASARIEPSVNVTCRTPNRRLRS